MSHRVRHRQIFAHLDGRLDPSGEKKLASHLAGCRECREYLARVSSLGPAARESFQVPPPDWSRVDRALDKEIIELTAERGQAMGWTPAALTLAAAAAVVLALALPSDPPALPEAPLELVVQTTPAPAPAPPRFAQALELLEARIVDSLAPQCPPPVGQTLEPGAELDTTAGGGVRLALGPTSFEAGESSRLEIHSLDSEAPAVALGRGRLFVSVPPFSFTHGSGVTILAGDASFYLLDGVAEFLFEGDTAMVYLLEGEIIAYHGIGETPLVLEPGAWRVAADRTKTTGLAWAPLADLGRFSIGEAGDAGVLEEREVTNRGSGSLPRELVLEALAPTKPKIRDCYEKALLRDHELDLSVKALLNVDRQGQVASVRLRGLLGQDKLSSCIEGVLEEASFPAPKGGPLRVVLPLRLSPKK